MITQEQYENLMQEIDVVLNENTKINYIKCMNAVNIITTNEKGLRKINVIGFNAIPSYEVLENVIQKLQSN